MQLGQRPCTGHQEAFPALSNRVECTLREYGVDAILRV